MGQPARFARRLDKFQKHLEIQVIKRGNIYKKASTGGDEEAEASDFEEDEEL